MKNQVSTDLVIISQGFTEYLIKTNYQVVHLMKVYLTYLFVFRQAVDVMADYLNDSLVIPNFKNTTTIRAFNDDIQSQIDEIKNINEAVFSYSIIVISQICFFSFNKIINKTRVSLKDFARRSNQYCFFIMGTTISGSLFIVGSKLICYYICCGFNNFIFSSIVLLFPILYSLIFDTLYDLTIELCRGIE